MGDVERVEDEEEGENGGVGVEIPPRPRPLQVDERCDHRMANQPEKGYVYVWAFIPTQRWFSKSWKAV